MNRASAMDAPRIHPEEQFQPESPPLDGGIISIGKYRKLTGDYVSTDARILERLQYLEQFFRVIVHSELDKHATNPKNNIRK